tara:strand:+ start:7357 stop:8307 length:951 start_codon:yes stop_codon:yes gene_type:complete
MLILKDLSAEVPDTNAFHWTLEELSEVHNKEAVLMYGYNASHNKVFHAQCENFDRKIYFNNWAPCEFAQARTENHDAFAKEDLFDEIYSICPYSNAWLNTLSLGRTYKDIFYPFHPRLIPPQHQKQYDVIYHGGMHGQEHLDCLRAMLSFNYRYCTMTHHINPLTGRCIPYATNTNLTFQQKIDLIARTKISVCYNIVHIAPEHVPAIQSYDKWESNSAFSEVGKWNVMPQFKTRMHEAAFSRTLNLVLRDRWNIAEEYYEPDTEFVYFDNAGDLQEKIKSILNNWKDYDEMRERAYEKSLQFTTQNFIKKIREDT